jgi:hypothetical protein
MATFVNIAVWMSTARLPPWITYYPSVWGAKIHGPTPAVPVPTAIVTRAMTIALYLEPSPVCPPTSNWRKKENVCVGTPSIPNGDATWNKRKGPAGPFSLLLSEYNPAACKIID